jgi:hypothetical protein
LIPNCRRIFGAHAPHLGHLATEFLAVNPESIV